ncbi:hypothetical protein cypCar_00042173, partial [Cyprinus carpio]
EEIISEFPCFRLAKMLLWDLRDRTNVDVDQQILSQLSVMASKVLQVSQSPLMEKFSRVVDDCEDGRLKKGLQLEAAILLLPALFKEDPGLLFEVEEMWGEMGLGTDGLEDVETSSGDAAEGSGECDDEDGCQGSGRGEDETGGRSLLVINTVDHNTAIRTGFVAFKWSIPALVCPDIQFLI